MAKQFGTDISSSEIVETLQFFDSWDDRYRYIIDLGKELPAMHEAGKTDSNLIRGCQSQVWLTSRVEDGRLFFDVDSDAFIVKGLLAIVMAAYNGKTPAEIKAFDIDGYFADLDLLRHLSPTRSNGLQAMIARILAVAETA